MTRPGKRACMSFWKLWYMTSPAVACMGKAAPILNLLKRSRSWIVYFAPSSITGKTKARSIRSVFVFR